MKEKIEYSEFLELEKKLEIKAGDVINVEEVSKSEKLIKLTVDFGNSDVQVSVTNIKQYFPDFKSAHDTLKGEGFLFITNLKPSKPMGIESTVMILPGQLEKGKMITVGCVNITKSADSEFLLLQ